MPGNLHVFVENQPVISIVNTIKDLVAQRPVGSEACGSPSRGASASWPRLRRRHGRRPAKIS
jgi:hypothetical protein